MFVWFLLLHLRLCSSRCFWHRNPDEQPALNGCLVVHTYGLFSHRNRSVLHTSQVSTMDNCANTTIERDTNETTLTMEFGMIVVHVLDRLVGMYFCPSLIVFFRRKKCYCCWFSNTQSGTFVGGQRQQNEHVKKMDIARWVYKPWSISSSSSESMCLCLVFLWCVGVVSDDWSDVGLLARFLDFFSFGGVNFLPPVSIGLIVRGSCIIFVLFSLCVRGMKLTFQQRYHKLTRIVDGVNSVIASLFFRWSAHNKNTPTCKWKQ